MTFFDRLLSRRNANEAVRPLYNAVVAKAREAHWYVDGGVADTIDGRFEMIAAMLSLIVARLELDADRRQEVAWLVELFVDDMEGQLRQIGIGDMVVGKHVGRMIGAFGGRIGAYRQGLKDGGIEAALLRNLYAGVPPTSAALDHTAERLRSLHLRLHSTAADAILEGRLP
jgi:cytochrome b pre-mRNA-processing protein 3